MFTGKANEIRELGSGGFDPYGISDMNSDTSSEQDSYIPIKGLNENTQADLHQQKIEARRARKALNKAKGSNRKRRRPNEPKARDKRQQRHTTLLNPHTLEEEEDIQPLQPTATQPDVAEISNSSGRQDDFILRNWTSPSMRKIQQEWIDLDKEVNHSTTTSQTQTSRLNVIVGRHQEFKRLLDMPHLRNKQQELSELLSAESEEEVIAMHQGQELERQRRAIVQGPLHVVALFGDIKLEDLAAIDSGATQNFVSKSWLYAYLRQGGNMKVLTFEAAGHETIDGTCFYTFGTVEIDVRMTFGTSRERVLKLIANVTRMRLRCTAYS